jgi:outer membrane protein TolC
MSNRRFVVAAAGLLGLCGPLLSTGRSQARAQPVAPVSAVVDAPLSEAARRELEQLLLPKAAREPEETPQPTLRLSFAEAVGRALARNPSTAMAVAEIRRAAALLVEARAASLPSVSMNASYVRLDNDRFFGQGDARRLVAGADQQSGNLTLAVPLVSPRSWAQWLHAKDNVRVAEISAADVRRQVAAATGRAYLQVLAQRRLVAVSEQARDAARAHSDFASERLAGGLGNRLDAVRAAQEWKASEAQFVAVQVGLLRAREALGVLLAADHPVDCDDAPALPAPALPQQEEAALGDALVSRADLRALQARVWASARILRHSFVDYLPTLQGTFAPFFQDPPSLVQPLVGWQAQLGLSWTLFDGGLRYGARAERQIAYGESKLNLWSAQLQARAEVRTALYALRRAEAAEQAASEAKKLADEALSLSTLAYRAGATSNLQVIDAERRARDAAIAAVQAEDAARQAKLDLLLATGQFPGD